jgi:hypothetical protein
VTITERIELLAPMPVLEAVHWPPAGALPAMTSTDAGRVRLRRWIDAGFPSVPSATIRVVTACARQHQAILGGLGRLPDPVRCHLQRNGVIVALTDSQGGFQAHLPRLASPDEPWQIIVLTAHDVGAGEFLARLGHEVAHAWLEPPADAAPEPDDPTVEIERQHLTVTLAAEWAMPEAALKPYRLQEWRAGALARDWGFVGRAADPDACMRAATLPGDR